MDRSTMQIRNEVSKAPFSDPGSLIYRYILFRQCHAVIPGSRKGAGGTASPGAYTGSGLHAKTKVGSWKLPSAALFFLDD